MNCEMRKTVLYDTTLRDGMQREGASLSVDDKLRIAQRLDVLGIDYIEGGFPGSNPKDAEFFRRALELELAHARIVAFGTIARKGNKASNDPGLSAIVDSGVSTVCIVAKSSRTQVERTLGMTPQDNLAQLKDSVSFLKDSGLTVFVDAEHYFDGFKIDSAYALSVVECAYRAGAIGVTLCDTNGGILPFEVSDIVSRTLSTIEPLGNERLLGVHFHNDAACGVADTLTAVHAGVMLVQGSVNGYGERCGNADMLAIIAGLVLKMGDTCVTPEQLGGLTSISKFVADTLNIAPNHFQPYVGSSAFAHKGGIHASGIERMSSAYQHIEPSAVGNFAKIVVSELAGKASLRMRAEELGFQLEDATAASVLEAIKDREYEGYSFEAADGSLAMMLAKQSGTYKPTFTLESFRVIAEKREDGRVMTEATIKILVGERRFIATAEGNGPINALDKALRKAIGSFYPELARISLTDYKVRVLDERKGTDAVTRVLIESGDSDGTWGSVGVSENIIEASWEALVDSIDYGLTKHDEKQIPGSQ